MLLWVKARYLEEDNGIEPFPTSRQEPSFQDLFVPIVAILQF